MLTVACWLYMSMIGCWFLAACSGGPALWMRWVLLGATMPVVTIACLTGPRTVRPGTILKPLGVLVAYGLVLGLASKSVGLAISKCSAFGATTATAVFAGSLLVERFGRDRVLAVWRLALRAFLIYSVLALVSGMWPSRSEGLYGPTGNPNMFGSLLATLGLILFLPIASGERRGLVYMSEAAVGLAFLIATRCRSAMLGIAVAVAIAVLTGRGSRRWLWSATILVAAGAALVAIPGSTIQEVEGVVRKVPTGEEGAEAPAVLANRLPAWEESWNAMLAGLPFGFGWGVKEKAPKEWTFDVQSLGYGREEGTSWLPVGEEMGVPGLALVAWLWIALVRSARPQPFRIRALAYAVLAVFFMIASFEGWFLSPGNWESMAFWTSVGILFARPSPAPVAPEPFAPAPALHVASSGVR